MKYPSLLLLSACLATCTLLRGADDQDAFRIRFGVLRVNDAGTAYILPEESTDLLRKFKDTGYRWGFEITTSAANLPFTYYSVIHLPAPPDQVTGDLAKANPDKPSATVTTATSESLQTTEIDTFWFDPGDPIGAWRIDVFVNGKLARTIRFQVRNG